ncbi:lysophospholipase [Trichophaea hybrida]|nr:lysophospholipase [Trichophaea hybrida]
MGNFDVDTFINSYSPTVALAFSGGGYRAMLSGAGAVKAMDIRTPNTTGLGQVGGLLQSATYMAGLSGGSWLLGSVILNNFTTISALQSTTRVWDLRHNILAPEGILHIVDTTQYYNDINDEVLSKALSRQFLNWTDGGPGVTWSSIALTDQYNNAEIPFPIVVADGRYSGEFIISGNTTVYEFNPHEFGSFDPTLYAFTPARYIGTNMTNGVPYQNNTCVRGFDNAGFIMGTSSSLFNQLIMNLDSSGLTGILKDFVKSVLTRLSKSDDDIADYTPNPFFGVHPDINPTAKNPDLTLVDGGEDLQNIPLQPLIQPIRNVDVIFAFDNSADTLNRDGSTSNWPNGTALVATYQRAMDSKIANGTLFPHVPDTNTFVNLGLNLHPTFFGCNGSNITAGHPGAAVPPLLVYIPNSPWSYTSNTSTMDMAYSDAQRDSMILNGFNIATQGNGTFTGNWPGCIGCAIIHREQERKGVAPSEQCKQCFTTYCWNGTIKTGNPPEFKPTLFLDKSGAGVNNAGKNIAIITAGVVGLLVVM